MAMQISGQISIANIRTEHGDTSGQDGLTEYYRKGTNQKPVPNNGKNNAIPTSGRIELDDFYGSVGGFATLGQVTMGPNVSKTFSSNFISMWTGAQMAIVGGFSNALIITGNRDNNYWKEASFLGATVRPANGVRSYSNGRTTWIFTSVTSGAFVIPTAGSAQNLYIYDNIS